jgi:hypothetical protein
MNVNKQFALGGVRGRQGAGPGGGPGRGQPQANLAQQRGGRPQGNTGGDAHAGNPRYTMEFFIRADNLLNRVNYGGFSGNMLSPFFGRPTSAQQPRRLTVGTAFRF